MGLVMGLALAAGAVAAQGTEPVRQPIPVPSGQRLWLQEVLLDHAPGALWARFRFLAPQIGHEAGKIGPELGAQDMARLCSDLALPYLAERGLQPARVVISLSDRDLPFGTADPAATQFFEAFRLDDNRCIWEGF